MAPSIFLIQEGLLVEMKEEPYQAEDLLQQLLALYPAVLTGDNDPPVRLLLVSREVPVPAEEGGGGRWSLDHLFLDQAAVPTLVEVKRSSDTRIRREVVGQMLDYAANGPKYWPIEAIQAAFAATCQRHGLDPDQRLKEFLGPSQSPGQFWQTVNTNLKRGNVRLVFVADEIPPELRRIVEFLNEHMEPTEILAIEIRQYVSQGLKTLVPRVIGETTQAVLNKANQARQWDEAAFFEAIERQGDTAGAPVARAIFQWARDLGLGVEWGKGPKEGAFYPVVEHLGTSHYPVAIRTGYRKAYAQMQFSYLRRPPFDEAKIHELRERLNRIPGVHLPEDSVTKYPSIQLSLLGEEPARRLFLDALEWTVREIRHAGAPSDG